MFLEVSRAEARASLIPLNSLIQKQTGLRCQSVLVKDAWGVGEQLDSGALEFGVLNGFEFAWLQEKHPALRPLVIPVVCKHARPSAYLVTRRDSTIRDFADLAQKELSFPRASRAQVCLFVERAQQKEPRLKIRRPECPEEALDDVVRGTAPAIVVDEVCLDAYRSVKPGCFRKLKVVKQSPLFPARVVLYREGNLDADTVRQFQRRLLQANRDNRSRALLNLFHLSSFDPVPQDYQQSLDTIRKAYPAPEQPSVAAAR
jgi:ABC-type phosphate/phosphonate transport system substrate-binding protein